MTQYAQLAGRLLAVEGGHRVVGRTLLGMPSLAGWALAPALIQHILDVIAATASAGFVTPAPGNDCSYQPVSISLPGVSFTTLVTA